MDVSHRKKASGIWVGCVAAALCALALPAAAQAGSVTATNSANISIAANPVVVNPYPSTLKVQGGDGPITSVEPFIRVTHFFPDDLDIALVSPTGHETVLMSDACGGDDLFDKLFFFNATAAAPLSDDGTPTLCLTGTWQPTNYVAETDNWAPPGPGTLTSTNLGVFTGRNPNGNWQLFVRDDANPEGGNIPEWGLVITTATAETVVPRVGDTRGTANPYPITKTFDTPDGQVIDDLNLKVTGFNHQHPDDVDMLLQAPTGEAVMVMSDACGDTDINNNFNWTFDDEAAVSFADAAFTNCTATSSKPVDFDAPENMPAPAPARPYASTMSAFDGLQGGAFRLFVDDDVAGDTGYINGWEVTMTTRPAAATGFAATTIATAEGQTAQLTVNRATPANLGPATVDVAINDSDTDASDYTAPPSKLTFARGETSKTLSIPIGADFQGEEPENFFVTLSNPTNDALLADATSTATVTIARSEPDNRFTVGAAIKKRNGSAKLPVTVPGAGTITAIDDGPKSLLKPAEAFAEQPGTTVLKLKPAKKAKRKLKRGKKIKLTAEVIYTPDGGSANGAEAPVTLKKKKKR